MFFHIYSNKLKCIVRNKSNMFWLFAFPIVLATLFNFAFSGLMTKTNIKTINIAVINDNTFNKDKMFKETLNNVSNSSLEENQKLFNITYMDKNKAIEMLKSDKIDGYVIDNNKVPELTISSNGINQTIIQSFLNEYIQSSKTANNIIQKDFSKAESVIKDVSDRKNYAVNLPLTQNKSGVLAISYFSLIAMTCLYGGFLSLTEVNRIQANQSSEGARVSLAPTSKLRVFLISMLAALTVQMGIMLVQICYIRYIIKIDMGTETGYIIFAAFSGSVAGILLGAMISSFVKAGENAKRSILTATSMTMVFLAGMMTPGINYFIDKNAPIINKLNPGNLISNSLYALTCYDTHREFFIDMLYLWVIIVVFGIISYLAIRRENYASI